MSGIPFIQGPQSNQTLNDDQTIAPLAAAQFINLDPGATVSALVVLTDGNGQATDANGTLSATGLTKTGAGTYALSATSAATLQSELQGLVFTPTAGEVSPGQTVLTGVSVYVYQGGSRIIEDSIPSVLTTSVTASYHSSPSGVTVDLVNDSASNGSGSLPAPGGAAQVVGSGQDDTFLIGPNIGTWSVAGGGGTDVIDVEGLGRQDATVASGSTLAVSLNGTTIDASGIAAIRYIDGTMVYDPDTQAVAIARLYQAGLGRLPDAIGEAYWVGRMASGASLHDLAEGFLDSQEFSARFPGARQDATSFVTQLYQNVLSRAPDASGLNYWVNLLQSGQLDQADVLTSFSESPENRTNTASQFADGVWVPDEQAAQVARLYYTTLGRAPDTAGLAYWANYLENGQLTLSQEAASFISSAEFQAKYGTLDNKGFVDLLYQNVLGRQPDATGEAYWIGQLNSGAQGRTDVVEGFSESPEHQAQLAASIENNGITFTPTT